MAMGFLMQKFSDPCFRFSQGSSAAKARGTPASPAGLRSTPEDDGTSRRDWKHLLHPLLRKNWDVFRISSGFNLFPFGSYYTGVFDFSKASLAGEIVSALHQLLL
mmetsp:Transcript_92827/g.212497  ORF Transcript_92827/g.212497 Transcript_92827/m.212497 type:complete len:105 (-) Transcript_92827:1448-1762(-)